MKNEEIKEILDLLNFNKDSILNRTCRVEDFMSREQIIKLSDYIANLQQENEKLKYNARGQVNDYFKDKYADEVLKKADLIKDYELTCYKNYELKQENEKLNNIINTFEDDLERELRISEENSGLEYKEYILIKATLKKVLKNFRELKESANNEG